MVVMCEQSRQWRASTLDASRCSPRRTTPKKMIRTREQPLCSPSRTRNASVSPRQCAASCCSAPSTLSRCNRSVLRTHDTGDNPSVRATFFKTTSLSSNSFFILYRMLCRIGFSPVLFTKTHTLTKILVPCQDRSYKI